jgi:hypothetical protein
MLTPVSILPYTTRPLYTDSPAPHNVSAISPLDPQLFTTIDQHAKDLINGTPNARYNTTEVFQWLEMFVANSNLALTEARVRTRARTTPEFRRAEEDILILNGLGTYYANLFRAALSYSIQQQIVPDKQQIGYPVEIDRSLGAYRKARDAWATMAAQAKNIYANDISYGFTPFRRGHWIDRLPAINEDIALLEKHFTDYFAATNSSVAKQVRQVYGPSLRPKIDVKHTAPETFHAGSELALAVTTSPTVTGAVLWYRHVNHGERWLSTPMQQASATYTAAIPGAYTDSPYPLQYYFEIHTSSVSNYYGATLHPPFNPTLSNQPYYAIHLRT